VCACVYITFDAPPSRLAPSRPPPPVTRRTAQTLHQSLHVTSVFRTRGWCANGARLWSGWVGARVAESTRRSIKTVCSNIRNQSGTYIGIMYIVRLYNNQNALSATNWIRHRTVIARSAYSISASATDILYSFEGWAFYVVAEVYSYPLEKPRASTSFSPIYYVARKTSLSAHAAVPAPCSTYNNDITLCTQMCL